MVYHTNTNKPIKIKGVTFSNSKYIISKIIKLLHIIIIVLTGQKIIYDSFSIKLSHASKELTTMAMTFKQSFQSDENYTLRVNFVLLVKQIAHIDHNQIDLLIIEWLLMFGCLSMKYWLTVELHLANMPWYRAALHNMNNT